MLHADRETMASEVTRVLKHEGKLFFRDFGVEDMRAGIGRGGRARHIQARPRSDNPLLYRR